MVLVPRGRWYCSTNLLRNVPLLTVQRFQLGSNNNKNSYTAKSYINPRTVYSMDLRFRKIDYLLMDLQWIDMTGRRLRLLRTNAQVQEPQINLPAERGDADDPGKHSQHF